MALLGLHSSPWNQLAPPSISHLDWRRWVIWGIQWYLCHLTPSESQWRMLYLVTLGGYFVMFCLCPIPNPSPVACFLALPFLLLLTLACTVLQKHHNSLMPSPFSIITVIQWHPVLKCCKEICHHSVLLQGSISKLIQAVLPPGYQTDANSPKSHPPILSSICWPHCSCPAPSFWQIASMNIRFASGWLEVCLLLFPGPMNHCSQYLHHVQCQKSLSPESSQQSVWHVFSTVPQLAGMFSLGG